MGEKTVPGSKRILTGIESNSPSEDKSAPGGGSPSPGGIEEGGSGDEGAGDGPGQQGLLQDPAEVGDVWDWSSVPHPFSDGEDFRVPDVLPTLCLLCHPR